MNTHSTSSELSADDAIEQQLISDSKAIQGRGTHQWKTIADRARAELEVDSSTDLRPVVAGIMFFGAVVSLAVFASACDHTGAIDNAGEIGGLVGTSLGAIMGLTTGAMPDKIRLTKKIQRRSTKVAKEILLQPVTTVDDDGVVSVTIATYNDNATFRGNLTFVLGSDDQEAIARRLLNIEATCKQVNEANSQQRLQALADVGVTPQGKIADIHHLIAAEHNEANAKRMKKQANEQLVRSLREDS